MFRKVRFQRRTVCRNYHGNRNSFCGHREAGTGRCCHDREITLRGRVLPIGGLKEKLLAAKNAGMKTVCIPKENEQDLAEISEEIVGDMEIIPVEHMDQVIKAAFV